MSLGKKTLSFQALTPFSSTKINYLPGPQWKAKPVRITHANTSTGIFAVVKGWTHKSVLQHPIKIGANILSTWEITGTRCMKEIP